MIKTDDFRERCNCREALCEHTGSFPEMATLRELTQAAAEAMYNKLLAKYRDGWAGWDDPALLPVLKNKLVDHIGRGFDPENMIDVMNLAAMIWNQGQP